MEQNFGFGNPQDKQDQDHLNLLRICYWVMAGLQVLGAAFAALWTMIMGGVAASTGSSSGAPDAAMLGGFFVVYGLCIGLFVLAIAYLYYLTGKSLVERRNKVLIYVMACLSLLSFPLGTVLGVFTLIVMSRQSVAATFR